MKNLFLSVCLVVATTAMAQDGINIVANETCQCVTEIKAKGEAITQMQLGLCMVKSYTANKSKFPPEMQVALTDSEKFENVAAQVGIKMVEICPDVIMAFAESDDASEEVEEEADIIVSGQVTEIRTEQFITVEMKDDKGKKYSMLMMFFFDTASVLTEGKLKKGDKVTASYTEIELYDPKMKEFRTYKILTDLSK